MNTSSQCDVIYGRDLAGNSSLAIDKSHLQSFVIQDRNGVIQKFSLISSGEHIIYQTKHKNRYSKLMTLALFAYLHITE